MQQILRRLSPDPSATTSGAHKYPFKFNSRCIQLSKGDAANGLIINRRLQKTAREWPIDVGLVSKFAFHSLKSRGGLCVGVLSVGPKQEFMHQPLDRQKISRC